MPIELLINSHTPAYFRLMKAGFYLYPPHLQHRQAVDVDGTIVEEWTIEGSVDCVCGVTERYQFSAEEIDDPRTPIDVALLIEQAGAVSVKHLKQDGFCIAEIRKIRRAYV